MTDEDETTPKRVQRNALDRTQLFGLADWIQSSHGRFDGKSFNQVARMAEAELGFPVSPPTVADIARIREVEWKRPQNGRQRDASTQDMVAHIERLQTEIESLKAAVPAWQELADKVLIVEQRVVKMEALVGLGRARNPRAGEHQKPDPFNPDQIQETPQ